MTRAMAVIFQKTARWANFYQNDEIDRVDA